MWRQRSMVGERIITQKGVIERGYGEGEGQSGRRRGKCFTEIPLE